MAGHIGRYTYHPYHDLHTFLIRHKPSEIIKPDVFWVCVHNPNEIGRHPPHDEQVAHLMWNRRRKETDDVTLDDFKEIATAVGFTQGKWQLNEKSVNVDDIWSTIAMATHRGQLGIMSKVSTKSSATTTSGKRHTICVYTKDFTDTEDVLRVENELRNLGLKTKLIYKPDIFNEFGVYFRNPWGIPHTLFQT